MQVFVRYNILLINDILLKKTNKPDSENVLIGDNWPTKCAKQKTCYLN